MAWLALGSGRYRLGWLYDGLDMGFSGNALDMPWVVIYLVRAGRGPCWPCAGLVNGWNGHGIVYQ